MNNGNVVQDLSSSPNQRKVFVNNNNININNNKNLNNNNQNNNNNNNENINDNAKNGSLSKNDKFRFGSSKTLSREEDRILKEMVRDLNAKWTFAIAPASLTLSANLKTDFLFFNFAEFSVRNGNTNERSGQILSWLL